MGDGEAGGAGALTWGWGKGGGTSCRGTCCGNGVRSMGSKIVVGALVLGSGGKSHWWKLCHSRSL